MVILIFDSKTKKYINTLEGDINIYSCGVTPYKPTHIGNLRVEIIVNIVKNIYKQFGYSCKHASNITDIGYLEDSEEANKRLENFTEKNYTSFIYQNWKIYFNDIKKVVNNLPEIYPASNFINENIKHIDKIKNEKYVIQAKDGIYISVDNLKIDKNELINYGKRISNFIVWKNKQKSLFTYNNQIGIPGWHIECFSIVNSVFKTQKNNYTLEIHAGGIDLMDIHNNCEILHHYLEHKNYFFSRIWLNINLLLINGLKMSKRQDNSITLSSLLLEINISIFMIMILSTHYQKQIDINENNKTQAKNRYYKIIKNLLTQIIQYKEFKNIYSLYNFLQNLKTEYSIYKKETNILQETFLTKDLNTVYAISYLQKIKINTDKDIYNFYILDKVMNTQILDTLLERIKNNIDKQYLYDKGVKPIDTIKIIYNSIEFHI